MRWLGIFLFVSLAGCATDARREAPVAVGGLIDLSDWDFERDGKVELKGEWYFGWQHDVGRAYPSDVEDMPDRVSVPKSWERYQLQGGEVPTQHGFGTYILRVKLPREVTEPLGLRYGDTSVTGELSVWGTDTQIRHLILEKGRFCAQASQCLYANAYEPFAELTFGGEREILVVVRASNWVHGSISGLTRAPVIGQFDAMSQGFAWRIWLSAVVVGVLGIVSIYFLCLYSLRPSDLSNLYFALICLGTGLREFLLSGTFTRIGLETSESLYRLQVSLEYVSLPLLAYVGAAYVVSFFDELERFKRVVRTLATISLGLGLFALTAPTAVVTQALPIFQLELIGTLVFALPLSVYYALVGRPFGKLFLASAVVMSLGTVNDLLHAAEVIVTGFYAPLALIVFVLMQSVTLASKFSRAMDERDAKSQELLSTYQQLDDELLKREHLEDSNAQLKFDNEVAAQQLIQADKLATLGTVVAGVAHDIANPNGLITGANTLMQETRKELRETILALFEGDESEEALALKGQLSTLFDDLEQGSRDVGLGAARIAEINSAIRNQARNDQGPSPVRMKGLVEECLIVVGHRLKGIETQVSCHGELTVEIVRSQFGQVLMNLIANAADAIQEHQSDRAGRILIGVEELADQRFAMNIDDSGPGVPDELRGKILEPFFTTKRVGKGTGLGMPIVLRILEAHDMKLEILDAPELGGARFRISPK